MRQALAVSLVALFLGGCASNPADRDISGTWINQVAIDAASKGGPLREALQAYGPNLEWDVNTKAGQARYTNGFENVEGKLLGEASGAWKVVSGPGEGSSVQFQADGQVTGLPGADRYALCLAGDCASMSGGNDNMWLQLKGQGNTWIFARKGKELEILQAVNTAQADEMPQFTPGDRKWLLEKQ